MNEALSALGTSATSLGEPGMFAFGREAVVAQTSTEVLRAVQVTPA